MKVLLSSLLLVGLCCGCNVVSTPTSTDSKSPSVWSNYTTSKAQVQLSVINAEAKSAVYLNGSNVGKTAKGGNFTKKIKVAKNTPLEIEFRIKRFTFGHIFRQEQLVRQVIKVEVNSIVVCDGNTKKCTVSPQ